jgi:hypothetical protein
MGCGQAVYEQRLENTKRYYGHLGQLNANLAAEWQGPGISIRPPLGFVLIPSPQRPENAVAAGRGDGADPADAAVLDERQPNFVNLDLPGLIAAWKWESFDAEGQARSQQTSYMYLLSNQEIGANPELREQALKFHDNTLRELSNTLEANVPRDDKGGTALVPEQFPANRDVFVAQLTYDSIALDTDVSNDRTNRTFSCHLFTQGEVQVIVLFVYSDVAEHQDVLLKRIPLCLETLTVSGDKIGVPATTITGPSSTKSGGF